MLTPQLRQEIENNIKNNKVVIFMKGTPEAPQCGFSGRAVAILQSYGAPVKGLDIYSSEELRQGIELTGFFLERHVFWPHNKPLPAARSRLMETLQR